MKKINHISIVISTRNAGEYINKCIDSALSQDYPDFEIIFIDACSTDGTFEKAKEYEKNHTNIKVIQNEKRKYQGENIRIATEMSPFKSIIITLDGDDWLPNENVLHRINSEYEKTGCWMTYGTYEEFPYRDVSSHYCEYPLEVRKNKTFRSYRWLASHLRTFRRELFLRINPEDMKDPSTGDYVSFAPDLSFQFPMLEMCGPEKSRYIPDINYVYNRENPLSEASQNQSEIDRIENVLRNKPVYETVENLYEDEIVSKKEMKNIKIFCSWDLNFDFYNEKQIELYVDSIPNNKVPLDTIRFVFLLEPIDILNLNQRATEGYEGGFYNFLLTHNSTLLNSIPSSHLFEFGTSWVKDYKFPVKKHEVSTLVGGKLMAPGHFLRQKIWFKEESIKNIKTKFYLSGNFGGIENHNNNPILGNDKSPLFDSQFHICIENTKLENWFTEKLIDCLQTKTIPIYWGCPNIGNWFNLDGFIIANDFSEIINACNSIDENTYAEKIKAVEENFEKSKIFATISDRISDKIEQLIKK